MGKFILFRAFAPRYEDCHQDLLQFIVITIALLLVNRVALSSVLRPSRNVNYCITHESYTIARFHIVSFDIVLRPSMNNDVHMPF